MTWCRNMNNEWIEKNKQINRLKRQSNLTEVELRARIEELEEKLAHYEDNCTIVWMPEDVLTLDDTLTGKQVYDVLKRMERKHDATLGISWDTVEFWIQEVKRDV